LIGDSGGVGVTVAPAPLAALNVVPGGVGGGRLSTIRLVWLTRSRAAIETATRNIAMITGFRRAVSMPVNGHQTDGVPELPGAKSRRELLRITLHSIASRSFAGSRSLASYRISGSVEGVIRHFVFGWTADHAGAFAQRAAIAIPATSLLLGFLCIDVQHIKRIGELVCYFHAPFPSRLEFAV
jgi:hypothetical protein